MADPFGVTAVTLSTLKIAKALHGLIVELREVPNQLLALSNETCNLKFVLDSVQELSRPRGDTADDDVARFDRQLGPLLFQARVKLDQLDNLVSKWCKTNFWGGKIEIKLLGRVAWRKQLPKVWQLQQEIREIRTNLTVLIESSSLSVSTRLSVEIQHLYSETERIYRRHSESLDSISEQISPIEEIHENSLESVELLQKVVQILERGTLLPGMDSQATLIPLPPSPEGNTPRVRFLGPEPASPSLPKPEPVPPTLLALPASRVSAKRPLCSPECKCACHLRRTFQAVPMLETILGRLFVGYSGLSLRSQKCDLETCEQQQPSPTTLTYFFPRWFVDSAISVALSQSVGTPTLNIKVRRPCSETNRLFALSRCEGVDGIRELFSSRAASPDDLDHRGGWSPLHFAVDHGCLNVCKFLLDCGADPDWEDNTGTSSVEVAWRNILHLKAPPELAEAYAVLFPGAEYLQERRFTHIHKLVIGLESDNLEDSLAIDDSLVNERDIDGWTPLHWAARRGNSYAVAVLLEHGADPFVVTENEKRGPLHLAAQSTSALCVNQLLQHRRGNKVLDIDQKDAYGCTPLRVAAQYNSSGTTAFLIKAGADLNEGENFGEGPLLSAVAENNVETATLLLRAGADYTAKTHAGNTILHLVANVGEITMVNILVKAHMHGLDLDARNSDGHTPAEKVEMRDEVPRGFHRAWDQLMQSVLDRDFDAGSWAATPASGNTSWYSFEEMNWYEAEAVIQEDVKIAESAQHVEDKGKDAGSTPDSEPRMSEQQLATELSKRLAGVVVRDMVECQ
ncbi:hypothetical protein FZEAL_2322 [Fusarium zealandicum]|uniref:Ankyrin n=1 Tax=Fusarium zealandicum TaxID=1053134 RepID=A0A8H4URQ5_9HYPO|nr:hypothetical protein FZEAL_2322 [Fusarium zealandicum]